MRKLLKRARDKLLNPVLDRIDERVYSELLPALCQINNNSLDNHSTSASRQEKEYLFLTALDYHRRRFGSHINIDDVTLVSSICRPTDVFRFSKWAEIIYQCNNNPVLMHRKTWEYIYISQALYERGMLNKGKRGLGFAVGREPLPSLFASYACDIMATDLDLSIQENQVDWNIENQHADCLDDLYLPHICDAATFGRNVRFEYLDMNSIPPTVADYDFCWSSCAIEHLGSLDHGKQFLYNMINCIKPGGIAVHTTEYNMLSNTQTITDGNSVLYRERDLVEIAESLQNQGHYVEPLDFRLDNSAADQVISMIPYRHPSSDHDTYPHFKLELDGYLSTSFGLIVKKKV